MSRMIAERISVGRFFFTERFISIRRANAQNRGICLRCTVAIIRENDTVNLQKKKNGTYFRE